MWSSDDSDTPEPAILTSEDVRNIASLMKLEIADNTRIGYEYQWRRFVNWAESEGHCALPAHPDLVTKYITGRKTNEGHRASTLRVALSAIKRYHLKVGLENPCASEKTEAVLRGASREDGRPPKQTAALMRAGFIKIRLSACLPRISRGGRFESKETADRRGKADIAMIGLMRDSLLRPSEAVAITWDDITSYGDGTGRLHIRRSKVDQEGEGAVAFISEDTMVILGEVFGMSGSVSPSDKVFGLKRKQLSMRIKRAALEAGLGKGFSGYSPRIGMSRDLARAGTALPSLMQAGRWESPRMPAHYIRAEEAGRNAVAQYYGYAL